VRINRGYDGKPAEAISAQVAFSCWYTSKLIGMHVGDKKRQAFRLGEDKREPDLTAAMSVEDTGTSSLPGRRF